MSRQEAIVSNNPQLEAVYRRLLSVGDAWRERVVLVTGSGDGVSAASMAKDPALAELLVDEAQLRIERTAGRRLPSYVAATKVLHDYAWPASLAISAPWHLEGMLPVFIPDDVQVDPATGLLLIDPSAEVRHDATADDVRRAVVDHHAPLLDALSPFLRRGPRAAWGTVADDLVSGVWWLGRLMGEEAAGVEAATRLVPSAEPPLPGGAAFRSLVADDGSEHVTRTRVACCLRYAIEPEACITCPRTSDQERRTRLASG